LNRFKYFDLKENKLVSFEDFSNFLNLALLFSLNPSIASQNISYCRQLIVLDLESNELSYLGPNFCMLKGLKDILNETGFKNKLVRINLKGCPSKKGFDLNRKVFIKLLQLKSISGRDEIFLNASNY